MRVHNGIGTKFLGIVKEGNNYLATRWVTFFYLPIFPLRRELVDFLPIPYQTLWQKYTKGVIEKYFVVIKEVPLDWKNILLTYFYGWILVPIFLFGPVIFIITVNQYITAHGDNLSQHLLAAGCLIGWLFFSIIRLLKWENRAM